MGGALWKEFCLNILSKLQYSSKNLFKQLRWIWILSLGKKSSTTWRRKNWVSESNMKKTCFHSNCRAWSFSAKSKSQSKIEKNRFAIENYAEEGQQRLSLLAGREPFEGWYILGTYFDRHIVWWFGGWVVWWFGCLVVWLFDGLVVWWFGRLVS